MVSAPYERKNGKPMKIAVLAVKAHNYLKINIADLRKVFACTVTYNNIISNYFIMRVHLGSLTAHLSISRVVCCG